MVFVGGWRSRRRRFGPQDDPRYRDDPRYGAPYGPSFGYGRRRGYGRGYGGGGGSCLRDMFLIEGGCCLAEMLGCGPQLLLVAPSVHGRHRAEGRAVASPAGGRTTLRRRLLLRILAAIAVYQAQVSPRRGPSCRFTPTCSHYATEALTAHGLGRGLWLTAARLVRCRPGATRRADPVPSAGSGPRPGPA